MEVQIEKEDRSLDNIVGAPYKFTVKDGTVLALDEWTISAEKWAKAHYGSMQNLYNCLMNIGVDDEKTIDAAIDVALYKLTDESRRIVEQKRGTQSAAEWLADQVTYKNFADLCKAEYTMIRDSIPLELLSEVKKNTIAAQRLTKTQGEVNPNKRAKK